MTSIDGSEHAGRRVDQEPPAWARTQTVTSSAPAADEGNAAIIRRAGVMGIPPWRVMAALGLPLPQG